MVDVTIHNAVVGLKVVRGRDWDFGNQDYSADGSSNKTGTIIDTETTDTNWVRVEWASGSTNQYPIGGARGFGLAIATIEIPNNTVEVIFN